MPRTTFQTPADELTKLQLKVIETELINSVQQPNNRWIYDKKDERYKSVALRNEWFENFGRTCVPIVSGGFIANLWTKLLNRYSSALCYYNKISNKTGIDSQRANTSKTLRDLSFLDQTRPYNIYNKSKIASNSTINKTIGRNSVNNPNKSLVNNNKSVPVLIISQANKLNQAKQVNMSNVNNSYVTNSFDPNSSNYDSDQKGHLVELIYKLSQKLDESNMNKNPQITGFLTSIEPLFESYFKLSNDDLFALEELKMDVHQLIIRKLKELKNRMSNEDLNELD